MVVLMTKKFQSIFRATLTTARLIFDLFLLLMQCHIIHIFAGIDTPALLPGKYNAIFAALIFYLDLQLHACKIHHYLKNNKSRQ